MTQKTLPYFVVDAFTHSSFNHSSFNHSSFDQRPSTHSHSNQRPFSGNPAAVCVLEQEESDEWLQQIAAEFNLSETAFLWHKQDNLWQLRWFTPSCEVTLCGHATLASAHVLTRELGVNYNELLFSTLSGMLTATVNETAITLNFPRIEPKLFSRIYLDRDDVGFKQLHIDALACYQAGDDIIVELRDEDEVLNYQPNFEKIAKVNVRGVILTAPSNNTNRDFVSRFFAPRAGINEDPVTGSAHCSLAILWSKKLGKLSLRAEQLSQRRGFLQLGVNENFISLAGECLSFSKGSFIK